MAEGIAFRDFKAQGELRIPYNINIYIPYIYITYLIAFYFGTHLECSLLLSNSLSQCLNAELQLSRTALYFPDSEGRIRVLAKLILLYQTSFSLDSCATTIPSNNLGPCPPKLCK